MNRFIDNLDYFEKRYKQELKDCDYLDLHVKIDDRVRYHEFKRQLIGLREIGQLPKDNRTPEWRNTDERISKALKAALENGENREWVLHHAKVSKMTYDRHLWNNPDLSELNRQLREQQKEQDLESAKVTTICIDMKTLQRYEFKKRILCDRKFGWRDGATAALINNAGKRKTTRLYKSRYLVFDAKDEDKYEI